LQAHPLDDDPVVMKRIAALVVRGGVAALVQLCKVKSDNIHEALSTILQSMAVEPKHRVRCVLSLLFALIYCYRD